jgi:hypothetical protein
LVGFDILCRWCLGNLVELLAQLLPFGG